MSSGKQRRFRKLAVTLALLVATAWVAPFFLNAERYRPLLEARLEQALHRKVTFGHIALHFFPQPGFTIQSVIVSEEPAFGMEPFARVDRIDCDLSWRSLWHSQLDLGTLRLHNPSINIVRDAAGEWNIETLLLHSQIARPAQAPAPPAKPPSELRIEAEGARLNFKVGQDKKPFAVVGARADVDFSFGSRRMTFRLSGDPVRTDLELPTPGLVELEGIWKPDARPGETLNATLRTQGALLYDWIPLVTGRNPGVYGELDSTIHLTGTLRRVRFVGDARLNQLHRSEQLPPSDSMPCTIHFRGDLDRDGSRLNVAGLDMEFAGSQVHVAGSIKTPASNPDLDLVVALERSRVQDLLKLGKRLLGIHGNWDATGRVNGQVAIQGYWTERRYSGFVGAQEVRLQTSSGTFPVSDIAIQISHRAARMAPARLHLAPGVELIAEGVLRNISPRSDGADEPVSPTYSVIFHSQAVALRGLLRFERVLGFDIARNLDADGVGSVSLHVTGSGWPFSKPSITGRAEIRSARLLIPGLTEPLNIARARVQIYGGQVVVNPVVAVMGTSVFSGWLMHEGARSQPWRFNLKADKLNVDQGSQWLEATSRGSSLSLFERLTGISSLIDLHRSSSSLFGRLNAEGTFTTPMLIYRTLALRNVQASVEIHERTIRVAKASFEAGNGRGIGKLLVNLKQSPARLSADVSFNDGNIQSLAAYLPQSLEKVRGRYFAAGHFEARGLTHTEIARSVNGRATVRLKNINLGNFGALGVLARRAGMDPLGADPYPEVIPSAVAHLQIADRHVTLRDFPLDLSGAKLELGGSYAFGGAVELKVHADLRGLRGSWLPTLKERGTVPRPADLHFEGTLRNLVLTPAMRLSQTQP